MTWTVIYREDVSGREGRLELEAPNRGEVLSQMRARRLRVLNVVEGRLTAGRPAAGQTPRRTRRRGAVALRLALALLVAAALYLLGRQALPWLQDAPFARDILTGRRRRRRPVA